MRITASEFWKIYDPSQLEGVPWYINDHCFIRDESGLWHMFGITHAEPANPLDEKFLAHATSKELAAPQWEKQPHVMYAQKDPWREVHVWAPHVIRVEDLYYMYYCAGDEDHSRYKIHLATSPDLWTWQRHPLNPMTVDGYDARDPMILRYKDKWIMYYTATSRPEGGNHIVACAESGDLLRWNNRKVVFCHSRQGTYEGPTESPFVVHRNGKYYLFVCTNTPYRNTAVYESDNPFHWEMDHQVGDIPAHAAEVLHPDEEHWFISRAGWGEGGLYLAELHWG